MPGAVSYLDFDLLIRRAEGGYRAQVLSSPAGEATADFTLPFSKLELENFVLRVGRPRRGTRRIGSPEMEAVRTLGRGLYEAVFGGDVRACWRASLDEAEARGATGLRLRLRIADAPELNHIPWEYLYNASRNHFLSLSEYTPLVRYLDMPERIRPFVVNGRLEILTMISSPTDYPGLDVEHEWSRLNAALAELVDNGRVRLERLPEARLSALQRRLRGGEYHILHFIGHGGFDPRTQEGVLVLQDETGKGSITSAERLGTILHNHRSLRLVVLNACEGARSSSTDLFAGTAQALVQQGIPAVIAMQFEITDQAAITLAEEFYAATADGYPVDAALSAARTAIFAAGNDIEWGTPVLYLRAPNGQLFSLNPEPEAARQAEEEQRRRAGAARQAEQQQPADAARQAEEERQRAETARLAAEERQRAEAARQAEEERQRAEAARLAEEEELRAQPGAHVFVSYSHQDVRWLNRLRTMLKPVERRFPTAVWSDRQIEAGARWASEIEQALASARVVLLLVSPSFLASDFIDQNELGPVLAAARDGRKKILWVLVSQCLWDQTAIIDYQAAHDISRPLDQLSSSRQNAQLEMVADAVARLLGEEERQAEEERLQAEAARLAEEEKQRAEAAGLAEEEKHRAEAASQVAEVNTDLAATDLRTRLSAATALARQMREGAATVAKAARLALESHLQHEGVNSIRASIINALAEDAARRPVEERPRQTEGEKQSADVALQVAEANADLSARDLRVRLRAVTALVRSMREGNPTVAKAARLALESHLPYEGVNSIRASIINALAEDAARRADEEKGRADGAAGGSQDSHRE